MKKHLLPRKSTAICLHLGLPKVLPQNGGRRASTFLGSPSTLEANKIASIASMAKSIRRKRCSIHIDVFKDACIRREAFGKATVYGISAASCMHGFHKQFPATGH